MVAAKYARAIECGLTPVLCLGETQSEREAGATETVIGAQLDAVLRSHRDTVVFADLNLRLNLLWITVPTRPHAWRAVADAVREALPQARVISPEGPAAHRRSGTT